MSTSDDQSKEQEPLKFSEAATPLPPPGLKPENTAERLCLEALKIGQSIWVDPEPDAQTQLEDISIRPGFCHSILRQIFKRRQENQDITSIYEWTNLNGPFTTRELQLVETTMALDKTLPFAAQMRPRPEQTQTLIRADFLRSVIQSCQHSHPDGISATTSKFCISGAIIIDELNLSHTTIKAPLNLTYCHFEEIPVFSYSKLAGLNLSGSYCPGLTYNGAELNGPLKLSKGFTANGDTEIINTVINGTLDAKDGYFQPTIVSLDNDALSLKLSHIKNSICLSDGFEATGRVNLRGTKCDLDLICQNASITNQQQDLTGYALICDNASINGNINLGENFSATGSVTCRGTRIGGNFEAVGGSFQSFSSTSKTNSLHFQNCHINNNLILLYANVTGRLNIENTEINGNCDLGYIAANNSTSSGNGQALKISNSRIKGSLLLAEATLKGQTYIRDTTISNSLDCSFSILENFSVKNVGQAFIIENSHVGHNFLLAYGFSAKGHVAANDLTVGHDLICNGGHFRGDVTFKNCRIKGTLSLDSKEDPVSKFEEQVRLINLTTTSYADDERSWPEKLTQRNFRYEKFTQSTNSTAAKRLAWLETQPEHTSLANQQLISTLTAMGKHSDAKTVAIDFSKKQYWQSLYQNLATTTQKPDHKTLTQKLGVAVRWPFYVLWWLVYGAWMVYGYRSHRILSTSLFVFLFSVFVYFKADQQTLFTPTSLTPALEAKIKRCNQLPLSESQRLSAIESCNTPELPTFSPVLYAMENQLHLTNLHQQTFWQPTENNIIFHIPSPSCLQLIKTCMTTKWVPVNFGATFLTNLIRFQSIFGMAAILALLYNLIKPALRPVLPKK